MKIIVPMAGRGSRLRPHTLTTPKPLIPIVGKPIVQRLLEDLLSVCNTKVDEIAFVIDRSFGDEVESDLKSIADEVGADCSIHYQDEKLGTAHAILMAESALKGNVLVAFADILFKADFKLDLEQDGIVWVQKVENPSAYGVVKYDENNVITDFVEKPEEFVSDLAIIGIYYFKDGENLRNELQYLIDNNIRIKGGEFGLTDALENMKNKGQKLVHGEVEEWLDCGNKKVTVETNSRYLTYLDEKELIAGTATVENSVIIPPVYLGEKAEIKNSVVGPYVSIGNGTSVSGSVIDNSLVQADTVIEEANLSNSMIGKKARVRGKKSDLSIGDFCEVQ